MLLELEFVNFKLIDELGKVFTLVAAAMLLLLVLRLDYARRSRRQLALNLDQAVTSINTCLVTAMDRCNI